MAYYRNIKTEDIFEEIEDTGEFIIADSYLGYRLIIFPSDLDYELCEDDSLILKHKKKVKKQALLKNSSVLLEQSPAVKINDLPVISLLSLTKTIQKTNDIEYADIQPNSKYLSDNKWVIFSGIPTDQIIDSKKNLFRAKILVDQKVSSILNDIESCLTVEDVDLVDVSKEAIDVDLIVDGKLLVEIVAPELTINKNNSTFETISSLEELDFWLKKEAA